MTWRVTQSALSRTAASRGLFANVIALWIGHEDPTTTHLYVEADLAMKEAALKRVNDLAPRHVRFKAPDRLLAFLETL